MNRQYNHPLESGFAERIHTTEGVKSLISESQLMTLLRELDRDGFDVEGAMVELTALMNYVTNSQVSMRDLQTHLDYCAAQLKQQLR